MPEHMEMQSFSIGGIDLLSGAIANADFEVVQLERGRLVGVLTHIKGDGIGLSFGRFSHESRPRRCELRLRDFRHAPGQRREATQWDCAMAPGDVVVFPINADHEAVYRGGAAYATVYLRPDDLDPHFEQEAAALGERSVVDRGRVYCASSSTRRQMRERVDGGDRRPNGDGFDGDDCRNRLFDPFAA